MTTHPKERVDTLDWSAITDALDDIGSASTGRLLSDDECDDLTALYGDDRSAGGEFVVVEQRPRSQSRATTTVIPRGHGVVFTTRDRPVSSSRGWSAAAMRHGLSTVRSGHRRALGVIFHDAA